MCFHLAVLIDEEPSTYGFAGDNATVILTNIDTTKISVGQCVQCPCLSNAILFYATSASFSTHRV